MEELEKVYSPKDVEDKWYRYWEEKGFFHASVKEGKKPYTIVIPPPNITGILTMGHVLNNTLQDVFIRWKRMQGYEACWIPGTDHAGIATQHVVERSLMKEGIRRREMGREAFVNKVWEWKNLYGGTIIKQLRKLGTSCDWQRERFTLDEGLSNAVQEVFIRLYEKGLVYRGKYIVNWCPKDHTALSDDEVNYSESNGHLWYINYPLEDGSAMLTVATTRPETMLGDTAVAVNPKDDRYKYFVGKKIRLPLTNRLIPVITDDFVDASFGTGAVKVTPAHDPNDFQISERHRLEKLVIIDTSGAMNDNVPPRYRALDRYECRKLVLRDLENEGLLTKTENHLHSVGHCYRCDTVIEPYLSDQWFVKMKPLAQPALQAVIDGRIRFYPDRWVKVYEHWMTNIRDWCISRQLWWGHRIPAYYLPDGTIIVARSKEEVIQKIKDDPRFSTVSAEQITQDNDVLDTWFSSWLWPFSILDWPKENPDLKFFYPTDTLVTGPDIIFFWVARMVMAGIEFADDIPFRHVYFTSIIRDLQGRKMSKTLGNSPDPLDVIDTYGADALRFTVLYLAPTGQDVLFASEKCEIGRNFANKIWNAGRFLLMHRTSVAAAETIPFDATHLADRWILSRFNTMVSEMTAAMDQFRVNDCSKILYDFLWHDFCDWYVEFVKQRISESNSLTGKKALVNFAVSLYEKTLHFLHPFMPFLTEELWQNLAARKEGESIMVSSLPAVDPGMIDRKIENEMEFLQQVISAVRAIRSEMNVAQSSSVDVVFSCSDELRVSTLSHNLPLIGALVKLKSAQAGIGLAKPGYSASAIVQGQEIFVPLKDIIDLDVERARLEKEITRFEEQLKSVEAKLMNPNFSEKAPADIIQKEKDKKANFRETIVKLQTNLSELAEN